MNKFEVKMISMNFWFTVYLLLLGVSNFSASPRSQNSIDVLEGHDVTLKCRFPDPLLMRENVLYWMIHTDKKSDNVAFGEQALDSNYKIDMAVNEGRYDLTISRASYDRDNGRFECRAKEGSGSILHSDIVNLTVLIPPGEPKITPDQPRAIEGRQLQLTCSSRGGSPDPQIIWYRGTSTEALRSVVRPGGGRDDWTTSVLSLMPEREDQGRMYRCVVSNRALGDGRSIEATVVLDVDYFPRITIGPTNPMRVLLGEPVAMTCNVDAKPEVRNVRWTRLGSSIDTKKTLSISRVTKDNAGRYICQADNQLGIPREQEVTLDVLYGPTVTVPSTENLEETQQLIVTCNVSANPAPRTIEWFKEGDHSFKQNGDVLRIDSVTAADQGNYICRAINTLTPTNQQAFDMVGNGTVAVRIRHAPGKSQITITPSVGVLDESVTLTCESNPPGWPTPKYIWKRHNSDILESIGMNYTIPKVSYSDEGAFSCQPRNSQGMGTSAKISLKVYEAPTIIEALPETVEKKMGAAHISLKCRAQGKPTPLVYWTRNDVRIEPNNGLYETTSQSRSAGSKGVFIVQSELLFNGHQRIMNNKLMAEDRGHYACVFENDIRTSSSSALLRVKHSPRTMHKENRVSYDIGETAVIKCLMRSFPSPRFSWMKETTPLPRSSHRYFTNITTLPEDMFSSQLTVFDIKNEDYGEYICKAENNMGDQKTVIKLQPKGIPDSPAELKVSNIGTSSVEISWQDGFNGGYKDTKFMAIYESTNGARNKYDCKNTNPCQLRHLFPQTEYSIRLQAYNLLGNSELSKAISVATGVEASSIPAPDQVFFGHAKRVISFRVDPTPLDLYGEVQKMVQGSSEWRNVSRSKLEGAEYEEIVVEGNSPEKVKIRLCIMIDLSTDQTVCGDYVEAKKVSVLPPRVYESSSLQVWVAALIGLAIALATLLVLVFCVCRRRAANRRASAKAKELEVQHRGVSSQAPPPPYYTVGRDNKALEGSMQTGMEDHKTELYQGYQHQDQANNGGGFLDHSYSNSNTGGSVNSQDSLWQLKNQGTQQSLAQSSSPAGSYPEPQQMQQQQQQQQQLQQYQQEMKYPYDPVNHAGYGVSGYGDYSHPYPPQQGNNLMSPMGHGKDELDFYPQQQLYNGDPYATSHKNKRDPIEIYNVSGMPSPYMEQSHPLDPNMMPPQDPYHQDQKPPQHITFDESLESGYSTPNSRNRRIIREIIV